MPVTPAQASEQALRAQPTPRLKIETRLEPAVEHERVQVEIRTTPPSLTVDSSTMRAVLNFRTITQLRDYAVSNWKRAGAEAIDRIVAHAHRLGDIHTREENVVANLAREESLETDPPWLALDYLPVPEVHYIPKEIEVGFRTVGGPTGLYLRRPEISFE